MPRRTKSKHSRPRKFWCSNKRQSVSYGKAFNHCLRVGCLAIHGR